MSNIRIIFSTNNTNDSSIYRFEGKYCTVHSRVKYQEISENINFFREETKEGQSAISKSVV